MSHESIRTILSDFLGMKRVAARLVPNDLNFLQKLNRVKAKNSTNIIEQPLYSPDTAPVAFILFPKLKLPLRGTHLVDRRHKREFAARTEVDSGKCV